MSIACHPEGARRALARGTRRLVLLSLLTLPCATPLSSFAAPAVPSRVENVLIVTLDGLRWQELFSGFDATLNTETDGGIAKPERLASRFDRPTPEARREALLPFFWTVVAREGQVVGDPANGSSVRVTNGLWLSYPGYNEMLSGSADPRVDSNDKKVNPNLTVLEWLNRRPGFEGRVAAYGSWDVLPYIVAAERSGLDVNGEGPAVLDPASDRERLLTSSPPTCPTTGRAPLRPLRATALGDRPVPPRLPREDGARPRHRPRPRLLAPRLDGPRRKGARRRAHLDGGDGPGHPGPGGARGREGHAVAARGHRRRAAGRGLPRGLAEGRPAGP